MDVTEHPAVTATDALIGEYDAAVADGKLALQLAYAFLACDILGTSVAVSRQGGPPEVTQHLFEVAAKFATARRHDALVNRLQVPDNLEGLEQ